MGDQPICIDDLELDELIEITKEAILDLPPSITTRDALAFRKKVEASVRDIKARGWIPELPFD